MLKYPVIGLLLLSGGLMIDAHAQGNNVGWYAIASGGGTSTNGQYSLSGTIARHDAGGTMTNGQYSVTGGFWNLPQAVQMSGAPRLIIGAATPGNALISWSSDSSGYVLQETLSLSPAKWTNSLSGATNPVVVPAIVPAKFYRLFKP